MNVLDEVREFMDANYACDCGDPECPQNAYESIELVRIMSEQLLQEIDSSDLDKEGILELLRSLNSPPSFICW